MNKEELFKKALDKWGAKAQLEMLQEEATELALATRKLIRNNDTKAYLDIISEIADVEIMIEQFHFIHDQTSRIEVQSQKDYKLNRLKERLK